ncbi:hypothetical protein FOA43_001601 [Brettanomyces nanus]|uniref:DNA polymerase epsilon subunit D n=1 Tax=Eeniella nana TaxID=13502 RepID=A0A875RYP5_EENNA|nr:uncharacterized protein FOA43_001601 [Brettanomyces nanus]QPG74276.1 hypothetical protein FOA43_001601 [Brettanomyces nanus]
MPAKGWRKDEQESNLETVMANQKVSIDSILFPKSTVNKLAKQVLQKESPDANPMILSKDSQTVIQRSSVVFINYIYHTAKQDIKLKGRKVVNAEDIINAMETTNFNSFFPILHEELDKFNMRKELKKREKSDKQKTAKAKADEEVEVITDEEDVNDNTNKRIKLNDSRDESTMSEGVSEETIDESKNDGELEQHDEEVEQEEEEEVEEDPEDSDDEENRSPVVNGTQQMEREQKELEEDMRDVDVDVDEDEDDDDDEDGDRRNTSDNSD